MEEEFELQISPLSQHISSGGRTVRVEIYGNGEGKWLLEIVDEFNNSTIWDEPFETDVAALTEAKKTILSQGVRSLIGPEDGKGNGEWQ